MDYMKNYLHNTQLTIFQRKEMFRMNTDTRYLGEFMKVKKHETILDIGTNNGALLLYASQFEPKMMIGVDIIEEAIQLAAYNLEYHNLHNFELIHSDIKQVKGYQVDVIVCNPPYFQIHDQSHVNENMNLQIARHEKYLEMHELFDSVKRLLKTNGRFYMVHRANRIVEILASCQRVGLGVRTLQFIHDENKAYASGILIEAIKGQQDHVNVLHPIVVKR